MCQTIIIHTIMKFRLWVEPYELPHDKTNKVACAPSEDSDQPGHPPSLIRVFAVRSEGLLELSFLHADSEDSDQTVGFVMAWLLCTIFIGWNSTLIPNMIN